MERDKVLEYANREDNDVAHGERLLIYRRWLIVGAVIFIIVLGVLLFWCYWVPFGPPWDPPKRMDRP